MGSKLLTFSQLGELHINTQPNKIYFSTMYKIIGLTIVMLAVSIQEDDVEFEPLPDYYSILQVSPTAKTQEIKKSFRKLAMKYHPDKNKEEYAQGVFQELSEAYSILSDAEKRRDYDELFLDEDELAEQYATDEAPSSPSEESSDPSSIDEAAREAAESSTTADPEEKEDSGDKSGEEVWGDLDDETLFKVLKFLADNDYEITKKTSKGESDFNTNRHANYDGYTRSRRSPEFNEYQEDPIHYRYQPNGHRYQPYAKPHDNESAGQPTRHSYCRTSVRWEGGIKVTSKSCY